MAKILVIEDTENNRVLLTRRLKPKGHDILTAEDAERGLAMALAEKPALILMDVGLPGMDGWTATRTLKADPALKAIPVIARLYRAAFASSCVSWRAGYGRIMSETVGTR